MATLSSHERYRLSEEKAKNWLETVNPEEYDDLESVSSFVESSVLDSSDSESGEEQQLGIRTSDNRSTNPNKLKECGDDTNQPNPVMNLDFIQNKLQQLTTSASFCNISITNSSNIVLGNIIKINDDLTINVVNIENQVEQKNSNKDEKKVTTDKAFKINNHVCHILPRSIWLIKEPREKYNYVESPVNLVIISHTATTSSTDQTRNIDIIRDIQSYHIDTYGWNDIAYNFLIGCDGNIYEGRGWDVEGAHCFGYNYRSIGISFIGCFMRKLPTEQALKACEDLLTRGIDEGHLSRDYKLLGHRQCSTTESPGSKLYEEIQSWKHFYNKSINEDL